MRVGKRQKFQMLISAMKASWRHPLRAEWFSEYLNKATFFLLRYLAVTRMQKFADCLLVVSLAARQPSIEKTGKTAGSAEGEAQRKGRTPIPFVNGTGRICRLFIPTCDTIPPGI
jgi:hypothetical protein